jgi:hypothetical protein
MTTGSACSSKKLEPSHVLLSCGLPAEEAHGSLRMTNSKYSTAEEIDYVLETLVICFFYIIALHHQQLLNPLNNLSVIIHDQNTYLIHGFLSFPEHLSRL